MTHTRQVYLFDPFAPDAVLQRLIWSRCVVIFNISEYSSQTLVQMRLLRGLRACSQPATRNLDPQPWTSLPFFRNVATKTTPQVGLTSPVEAFCSKFVAWSEFGFPQANRGGGGASNHMAWFWGGLVFKAQRLLYQPAYGLRTFQHL